MDQLPDIVELIAKAKVRIHTSRMISACSTCDGTGIEHVITYHDHRRGDHEYEERLCTRCKSTGLVENVKLIPTVELPYGTQTEYVIPYTPVSQRKK